MFLKREEAIAFIGLCKNQGVGIYGFDGFHLLPNDVIQIDQEFSPDYSDVDSDVAYNLALKFFEEHQEKDIGYEFVYDDPDEDWKVIRAMDEAEKLNAENNT